MQGHLVQRDAARLQGGDQRIGEMQPRGRRRDRAFLLREHGLVVVAVALVGLRAAPRYRAATAWLPRSSSAWSSTAPWNAKASVTSPPSSFSSTVASSWPRKHTLPSVPNRMTSPGRAACRLREGAPARAVEALVQGRLDPRARIAAPDPPPAQARRNDPAVIDHECVAGPQQIREDRGCRDRSAPAPAGTDHQQPRGIARRRSGRNAIRSAGSSKSNRSVRMPVAERLSALHTRAGASGHRPSQRVFPNTQELEIQALQVNKRFRSKRASSQRARGGYTSWP